MKNQLSPICSEVVILDFTDRKIVKYADVAKLETPGAWRKPTGPQRWYIAHYSDGTTKNFSSQFPVYHLPPSLLDKAHRTAREALITTLADLYASILDMPRRKKGGQHGV